VGGVAMIAVGWNAVRVSGAGAQLTQPGHSEIAGMDSSKGSDPDDTHHAYTDAWRGFGLAVAD